MDEFSRESNGDVEINNILLLANTEDNKGKEKCKELLESEEKKNLLAVTYTQGPDEWFEEWKEITSGESEVRNGEISIISVGEGIRSVSTRSNGSGKEGRNWVEMDSSPVETVADPRDVSELGIKISKQLERWRNTGRGTVVCFDSVSIMLEYTDLQTAFSFLYLITRRIKGTGSVAHFQMDPELHDDETVNTLKTVFNTVVDVTDNSGFRDSET